MKPIIIQIRGANAAGKTTAVKQYIEKYGMEPLSIDLHSGKTIFYADSEHKRIVLGRYDKPIGGVDNFKGRKQITEALKYAAVTWSPHVIIFEGFICGKSFKFTQGVYALSKLLGYSFLGITLVRSFENTVRLLRERNNNSTFSIENLQQTVKEVQRSHEKLKSASVPVRKINADNFKKEDMWQILEVATWTE